nr:hypothetical protein, unlikely [Trypanosoma brucei]
MKGRGDYMQNFFDNKVQKMLHRRRYEGGKELYGDHARPMREMKEEAQSELQELCPLVRTHAHPTELRTREERCKAEEELLHDEELVASEQVSDWLNFRRETLMNRFREEVSSARGSCF